MNKFETLLEGIDLQAGAHYSRDSGVCAMEAVAWLAGEPHSDKPMCVCPVIGAFMRAWNDNLRSNEERNRLLKPLLPLTIGTRRGKAVEDRRAFMCMNWVIRVMTPIWLEAMDHQRYAGHVAALRASPEIADWQGLSGVTPILIAAQKEADAAWGAARAAAWASAKDPASDAAWDNAGDEAWDAVSGAAGDAAWASAKDAAWAAAWDALWAAARAAASDAAWASAWAAAWNAASDAAWASAWAAVQKRLAPVTDRLQQSATELVKRMCEIG